MPPAEGPGCQHGHHDKHHCAQNADHLAHNTPIFNIFSRGGLHFGHHTTSNRDLTVTKRGELHDMRLRHADDTPPEGFM